MPNWLYNHNDALQAMLADELMAFNDIKITIADDEGSVIEQYTLEFSKVVGNPEWYAGPQTAEQRAKHLIGELMNDIHEAVENQEMNIRWRPQ